MEKKYSSPDKKHLARLIYESEIRFGPAYFRLEINGLIIPGKLFGGKLFWSPNSKYIAAEEWLTTDYSKGPVTRLLLIDLETKKACAFKKIHKGFLKNVEFLCDGIKYIKEYASTGQGTESVVDYANIINWKKVGL
ncbi:hypothetical protein [Desulfatitalea alkaliphila]|uniref:Uncharacterized protein n=1 Tax=Desulfatitalea alkaliphila TaxID=2929485 RepID=A0AA41R7U9_9BACT|nr:hypothetical protein [Desulfatitalea alkaliphila]MCJ8503193.1 hypothetical protein [Desulfatitalea alkaliphila]